MNSRNRDDEERAVAIAPDLVRKFEDLGYIPRFSAWESP